MALPVLTANYVNGGDGSTTGWWGLSKWTLSVTPTAGSLIRQNTTPTVGNERAFVCIVSGLTGATEPTWVVTRGARTTDNLATWQECTGQPATNGDLTNTIRWSVVKNTSVSLGVIIKDASNNLFICTASGTAGNGAEPTWNTTVGNTTTDNTVTWTCIQNAAYAKWAAPHARLSNAYAANWGSAGDDFYVGDNHNITNEATLSNPGTVSSPCRVLCVNHSGSTPPVSADLMTTAIVGGSGAVLLNGIFYAYGIIWRAGVGSASNAAALSVLGQLTSTWQKYEACTLESNSTGTSATIAVGNNYNSAGTKDQQCELVNTIVKFNAAGQGLTCGCPFYWRNTASAIAGTTPTTLFLATTGIGSWVFVNGVDLSALGSGKNLVNVSGAYQKNYYYFEDCKLGASVAITTGSVNSQGGTEIWVVNCDSASTNYRYQYQNYQGTITQETTIVRTGGATDGTTPVSRKMVTTANSKFYSPLASDPILYWNDLTGASVTLTVPVITDNVTLKNNDAWIEVEYLKDTGDPLGGGDVSNRASDVLAAGTNQATDSTSSWTTTGLTTPVLQSLSATITPQKKGPLRVRVMLAKASTTMYFDPLIRANASRSFMVGESGYLNQEPGGGPPGVMVVSPGFPGPDF